MRQTKDSRNPCGLVTRKPISLRLMPQELADAERIAQFMGITKSKLARDAYLAGLPIVAPDLVQQPGNIITTAAA